MIELLKSLFVALDEDKVMSLAQRCVKANINKYLVITALNDALKIIGEKFERGEYTLSDLMMAGIIYEEVMSISEFDLSKEIKRNYNSGLIVLGTIESDMHDIGKSMFKNVAGASGFNVIDLGVNVSSEVFCEKIKKYKPDILGISAVLSTTIEFLYKTIEKIKQENLKDTLKIIIGGNMADDEICKLIGADACTNNALQGVEICKKWVSK